MLEGSCQTEIWLFGRRLQCPCTSTLLRSGSAWFFHPPAAHQSKTLRFRTGVQEFISDEAPETVPMSSQVPYKFVLIIWGLLQWSASLSQSQLERQKLKQWKAAISTCSGELHSLSLLRNTTGCWRRYVHQRAGASAHDTLKGASATLS